MFCVSPSKLHFKVTPIVDCFGGQFVFTVKSVLFSFSSAKQRSISTANQLQENEEEKDKDRRVRLNSIGKMLILILLSFIYGVISSCGLKINPTDNRRCMDDVRTLKRRCNNVALTSCAGFEYNCKKRKY